MRPLLTSTLLPILTATGFCQYLESVAASIATGTRSPLVLGPFRVFHVRSIGDRYRPLPLLSFSPCEAGLQRVVPLRACVFGRLATLPDLYPLGCCAPSGNSPEPEPSAASGRFPALRFDGLRVLLSVPVGICEFRAETLIHRHPSWAFGRDLHPVRL